MLLLGQNQNGTDAGGIATPEDRARAFALDRPPHSNVRAETHAPAGTGLGAAIAGSGEPASVRLPERPRIEIFTDLAAAEADWRVLESSGAVTVFQQFDRLAAWQRDIGALRGVMPAIVIGYQDDAPLFVLPLCIESRHHARRLTWLGAWLNDYNAPLLAPEFVAERMETFGSLWSEIVEALLAREDFRFDIVDLPKMPETVDALPNPFLQLDVRRNASNAHIAQLGRDWQTYYSAMRSSSTRKKERQQRRQLGEFGEVRFSEAESPEDAAAIIDVIVRQKTAALTKMGVASFLTWPGHREFLIDIATEPALRPVVNVTKLEVGEDIVAASMGLQFQDCYYLVLSSYEDGPLARFGPGRIHLNHLMQRAIEKGFSRFDFTIGDEVYKLDWSDIEAHLFDLLTPVTLRGHLIVAAESQMRKAKRIIKRNPHFWSAFRNARAYIGSRLLRKSAAE